MNLIVGEKILLESDTEQLVLTTHKVRFEVSGTGFTQITSIMLEEVVSCAITRTSSPILLVLAALAFVVGYLISSNNFGDSGSLVGGAVAALLFVLLYFSTRREVLEIASADATIKVNTRGMSLEAVKEFIDAVEAAKNERYLLITKNYQASQHST